MKFQLKAYLSKGLRLLRLNGETAVELSRDSAAAPHGILVMAFAGLLASIGAALGGFGEGAGEIFVIMLTAPVLNVAAYSISLGVFHAIARILGGKALFIEYYRAASFVSLIGWAQIIPALGIILSLWSIPVNILILEKVHGLKRLESVTVVVVMMGLVTTLLFFGGYL